ncbi:MAG TPA: MerR family transcriptional regulator [Rubrobacteraceae bacterium]|nr:MerR family transcriptional regulator [Rubrobacteraceae bacterium]
MATNGGTVGFSIGEVSQAIGLAPQTLRLWERERLIHPQRTGRGYRVYSETDVERLRKIKHLRKTEGLNFAAIRKQIGTAETRTAPDTKRGARNSATPGEQLRKLRIRAHKTLKEVSEATGLSISFISALERGGSGASVASLRLLAGAYGVSMREVFGADLEQNSPLVRSDERPVMQWDNGVRFEEMASGEKVMDPSYIKVPPGGGSEGFYSHNGEEFIYIISGTLFVELKDQGSYHLTPGDTLYFPSTTPHRWWAEDEPVEAIYVNTPPTF